MADVCKMNRQRLMSGVGMDDEWRPVELAASEAEAREKEAALRRELKEKRKAVEAAGGGPYPEEEEKRDEGTKGT
jgi:hypothetical protein